MNCHCVFDRVCAVCGMLAACSAAASDINRCRDSEGHVVLTDQPCAQLNMEHDQVVTETVPAATDTSAVLPAGEGLPPAGARDEQVPAAEPKRSPWADLPHPLQRRPVTLDVATLQTARNTILMQDEMRRQRKIASAR
jgi:hypothetical protein